MDDPPPYGDLPTRIPVRSELRKAITAAIRKPEPECVPALLPLAELSAVQQSAVTETAKELVASLRGREFGIARENMVQGLLQEFSLSSEEGVALMCLAEALLRIPDSATRNALIRDKIGRGDWRAHLGQSASPFINAATWGLLITGKLVATHDEAGLANGLTRVTAPRRTGDPQGGRSRDAPDGQAVRRRRDDRRCARARRALRGDRFSLFVRHARRSGDDGRRR